MLKFQIFFGVLDIPIFFFWGGGVNGRCWSKPTYEEKNESTPLGLYIYLYTFCCFDYYIWYLYFIFCVLPFVLKILSSERFLSFIVFCLLCFNFRLFTFVFCV